MGERFDCRNSDREDRPRGLPTETGGRRELATLLAEIRSVTPSPAAVVDAVRHAAAGDLSPHRLDDIERSIHALFRLR